jgi:hypothetical protein
MIVLQMFLNYRKVLTWEVAAIYKAVLRLKTSQFNSKRKVISSFGSGQPKRGIYAE